MSDSELELQITEAINAKRNAGKVITPKEEDEIRAAVHKMVQGQHSINQMAKLAEDEETQKQFAMMNTTLGLPGAIALYKAMLENCGLSKAEQKQVLGQSKMPFDLDMNLNGAQTIRLADKAYNLVGGAVAPDYDFVAARDKLFKHIDEKNQAKINKHCELIIYFTRGTFVGILDLNAEMLQKEVCSRVKLVLEDFKTLHFDSTNLTFYLKPTIEGKPQAWNPRFGITFKKISLEAADKAAAAQA